MLARRLMVVGATILFVLAAGVPVATPAWAAAPTNDDSSVATVIDQNTSLPIHEDTTQATTNAEETSINQFCGAPRLDQGVWFVTTAPQSGDYAADARQSDYSVGVAVLSGTPGNFTVLACGPGSVAGPVNAGDTVYLLVFGDGGFDGNQPTSGNLVLDIRPAVPPPTIDVTVNKRGTADKRGVAHISGTVTCTSNDGQGIVFDVFGFLDQRVGRGHVQGSFDTSLGSPCDGTPQAWAADVPPSAGRFGGGKAANVSIGFGCGTDFCNSGYIEATIQLSRNAK